MFVGNRNLLSEKHICFVLAYVMRQHGKGFRPLEPSFKTRVSHGRQRVKYLKAFS